MDDGWKSKILKIIIEVFKGKQQVIEKEVEKLDDVVQQMSVSKGLSLAFPIHEI